MKHLKLLYGVLCLIILSQPLLSQEKTSRRFPNSPTGNAAEALLNMLEEKDDTVTNAFIKEKISPDLLKAYSNEEWLAMLQELQAELQNFQVTGLRKTGEFSVEMRVETKPAQEQFTLMFDVEAEPPHRFTSINIESGEPSEEAPFASFEEMEQYLQDAVKTHAFSGAVLVAKNGEAIYKGAFGLASKRYKVPNQIDTKFNIGSLNKMFTGVAILQLAEKGKLKLDDPIAKYLPDFPPDVANKVTIRHLLQHSSGWGHYWQNEQYLNNWIDLRKISDYMAFIKDIPLDFEPGTDRQYSNTGYQVLGGIIESASGQDYYEYIRQHIYQPANMKNSDAYEMDDPVENLATGYTNSSPYGPSEGYQRNNVYLHSAKGTAAGGGFSTVDDLLNFLNALRDHQLISRANTNLYYNRFRPVTEDNFQPRGAIGKAGGAPGINAGIEIDFDLGLTVIILSNYDPPVATKTARMVMQMAAELDNES